MSRGSQLPGGLQDLRWRAVAYFMDGTGSYAIAVLAIVATGVMFSSAFHSNDKERRTFHQLVGQSSEPFRGEVYQVANAAVMLEVERAVASPTWPRAWGGAGTASAASGPSFCESGEPAAFAGVVRALEQPRTAPAVSLEPCNDAVCGANTGGFWYHRSDDGLVRVPPWGHNQDTANRWLADLPWSSHLAYYHKASGAASVKTMYYILPSGAFSISDASKASMLPGLHPLQGASYVRGALSSKPQPICAGQGLVGYRTRPYIDLVGEGLIETICAPVIPAGVPEANGVFCVDRGLPERAIADALVRLQHIFRIYSIVLVKEGGQVRVEDCGESLPGACSLAVSSGSARAAMDDLEQARKEGMWIPSVTETQRVPDQGGGRDDYMIVLPARQFGTQGGAVYVEAIVLIPKKNGVVDLGRLTIGLIFLVVAGATVFYSLARQRERARLAILQGLPMPVLVTQGDGRSFARGLRVRIVRALARALRLTGVEVASDGQADRILFANAAAESLLDTKLPRFPNSSRLRGLIRMAEVEETRRLQEWFSGSDRETYLRQTKMREAGEETEYELTLVLGRYRGRRVRIRGTWIRRASGRVDSFGVLELKEQP